MTGPSTLSGRSSSGNAEEIALLRQVTRESVGSLFSDLPADGWADSWPQSWKALEEQGLWSTIVPPDGSLTMALAVAEELGRALYPGPAYEALAGALVLSRLDDTAVDVDVRAAPMAAFVCATAEGHFDPVVSMPSETVLIVCAGDAIGAVPAGRAHCADVPSSDLTRRVVSIRLQEEPRPVSGGQAVAARGGRVARGLLYCADTLGCVQRVVDKTTEYAKQRTTFGSPIGKYQAVAHRLVDHAVTLEQMRLVILAAAAAFDSAADDLGLHLAIAETFAWGRGTAIISDCIQLCGGIGFTWEWGHHFYLRRVIQNTTLGGGFGRPHGRLASEANW